MNLKEIISNTKHCNEFFNVLYLQRGKLLIFNWEYSQNKVDKKLVDIVYTSCKNWYRYNMYYYIATNKIYSNTHYTDNRGKYRQLPHLQQYLTAFKEILNKLGFDSVELSSDIEKWLIHDWKEMV